MDINNEMAELFYEQCCGESAGHMAMIPNSPILKSIAKVHGIKNQEHFAVFLREVANWLDGGGQD